MKKLPIGYQLYSAREDAQKDFAAVCEKLSQMGYDGVEFAGFYGKPASEIKSILEKNHLQPVSSHVALAEIMRNPYAVIAYHLDIECKYIAIPYLEDSMRPNMPGFASFIKIVYNFALLCKQAGITLLYHNHDFEFEKVCGIYGLDFLYSAVSEELLKTEIDTCWVKYAGEDPAAYVLKYKGRAPIVHMKDYVGEKGKDAPYGLIGKAEAKKTSSFEFRPVGYGCQDVKSIVAAAVEAGADWLIVEQDEWYGRTPMEAAKMSIDTLRSIE